jgi:pyridoxine 5'-phosphate synthase PdxJ
MSDVMYAVYEAFGSAATYMRPEEVVEELRSRLSTDDGWEFEQDKYGVKMVNVLELDDGELRVAVVVNKSGELRLDIRSWFDPEVN